MRNPYKKAAAPKRQVVVKLRSFSRSLPMTLLNAREAVMQRFRSSLQHFGITEQQWRVLRALNTVEEIEATALARATSLLPPSLSRILRDLEARGLVLRRPGERDRRRSLIAISEDGARLIDAVGPCSDAIYAEITSTFGEERLAQLQDLLRELTRVANALPPVASAHPALSGATGMLRSARAPAAETRTRRDGDSPAPKAKADAAPEG